MACGCRGNNNTRTPIFRPVTSARSVQVPSPSPRTITPQPNQSMTPNQPINPNSVQSEKRRVQALRRDAIRKSLNK